MHSGTAGRVELPDPYIVKLIRRREALDRRALVRRRERRESALVRDLRRATGALLARGYEHFLVDARSGASR